VSGAESVRGGPASTTVYPVRDTSGELVAEHVRKDRPDGSKDCKWRRPGGGWGLNGTRLEELPLYGSERLADWPEEYPVVLVEGEKAADALNRIGHILAVGTVTGAAGTPGPAALEALRGREVVAWPDADGPGHDHMESTLERLHRVASTIRFYTWDDAPEKGADAADHPAVTSGSEKALGILLNDLLSAPVWQPTRLAGDVPPPGTNSHDRTQPPERFNLTDLGNAERFTARHGGDVRYCYPWTKWLVWTGSRWERDDAGRVHRLAKDTVRSIYGEAAAAEDEDRRKALAQHATRSEAEAKIRAMLELAKSEIPVSPDELDADPWLLNAPNGTVDLRTGELRAHRREDLLTKMAGTEYHPAAPASAWGAFLERVLPGEDLRTFVQRSVGYSATGETSEQVMFINHGGGANGKSTSQEAVSAALGDYAMRTPTETLLAKRVGGVPNDVARLKGARFVAASETEEGRRLAESLVKDLTGQDTISARFMRAEWFDFKPTHKLWLSTNHKPEIRGTDNAIWRRIRLIPWSVTIPPAERDLKLSEKLCAELPGILAWIVQGCLAWRRDGLRAPDEVRQATSEYRAEMDLLAGFFEDCCVVHRNAEVGATDLYNTYKSWAETSGERIETQRKFGTRLAERGFTKEKIGGLVRWFGIGLRSNGPEPGLSRSNGPGDKTSDFAGKILEEQGPLGPSGPRNAKNADKNSPRGVIHKDGPKGPKGPKGSGEELTGEDRIYSKPDEDPRRLRWLTEEEAQRVQKLISEGMKPNLARAEVLGEGKT
jgi:P4 family phage/plasmid primase-like protien